MKKENNNKGGLKKVAAIISKETKQKVIEKAIKKGIKESNKEQLKVVKEFDKKKKKSDKSDKVKEEQERTKVKKRNFIELFSDELCDIGLTCKRVGISRETYYKWMEEDEDFKESVDSIKYHECEFVESKLKQNIKKGKETSINFFLKCKHPEYKSVIGVEPVTPGSRGIPYELRLKKMRAEYEENKRKKGGGSSNGNNPME